MWKNDISSFLSHKCYKHTHDVGLTKKKTSEIFNKEKNGKILKLHCLLWEK